VALAIRTRYNLILMDLSMPEMDGPEAIKRLRTAGASKTSRIAALTAHVMPARRDGCWTPGLMKSCQELVPSRAAAVAKPPVSTTFTNMRSAASLSIFCPLPPTGGGWGPPDAAPHGPGLQTSQFRPLRGIEGRSAP
jgi:hypothetical protein